MTDKVTITFTHDPDNDPHKQDDSMGSEKERTNEELRNELITELIMWYNSLKKDYNIDNFVAGSRPMTPEEEEDNK